MSDVTDLGIVYMPVLQTHSKNEYRLHTGPTTTTFLRLGTATVGLLVLLSGLVCCILGPTSAHSALYGVSKVEQVSSQIVPD